MTFVSVARALGTAVVCATAVAACSGSDDVSPVSDPAAGSGNESEPAKLESVGRFKVTVDPMAAEPILFEPIEEDSPKPGTQATTPLPENRTVMSSISLTGPGTWNAATQTLTAPVVMTHTGSIAASFNEPQMVVTALSDTTGTVTFETSDNPGVLGVGATLAFADMQRPGAANVCGAFGVRTTASHALVIKDTNPATSFSFTVDVRAFQATTVSPDCDNDGRNSELQDAGGDCNDANASITSGCDCTQCTTAGVSCDQPLTTGGQFTCNSGCSCNIDGTGGTDVNVACPDDCNVNCDGAIDGTDGGNVACRTACSGGSTCALDCSNLVGDHCRMACSQGSTCDLNCSDNTGQCEYQTCSNASTCNAVCIGGGTTCGVSTCGNGGDCAVTCGTATQQASMTTRCGINACNRDATCLVTCVNPGPQGCTLRCTSDRAEECRMDCSAIPDVPAGNQAAQCKLTCPSGQTKTALGGGIFVCQ
jgi:hypothetical protein